MRNNKIIWIVLIVFSFVIICYKISEAPPSPFVTDPDTIRAESKRYLDHNKFRFNRAIEKIKSYNFQHPIRFTHLGRGGGDVIIGYYNNGRYQNITNQYLELRDYLLNSCDFNRVRIYSDSVFIHFYAFSGIVDRVVYSLCYTEKRCDDLKQYRKGVEIFTKEEIPNTKRAYYWEIEDNWYVYSRKRYFKTDTILGINNNYEWAQKNKECYFWRVVATLDIIIKELQSLSLRDNCQIIESSGIGYTDCDISAINYLDTPLSDSLFADIHYDLFFSLDYTHNFIRVNISNDFLKYYYTELPQDSLECLVNKKVFKLKENWYYEDF